MPVKGLTQAEIDAATAAVVAAGGKSTDRANRLPGETATEANARITAAYKAQPKPELTQEGKAAGATMEFVRTGAGGVGEYKEIWPIGTPIPEVRTTNSGGQVDVSGTSTGTTTTTPTVTNASGKITTGVSENVLKYPGNPIIAAGGSSAGKDSTGKEVFYKSDSTDTGVFADTNVGFYYGDGSKVPTDNLIGVPQVLQFVNAGWSIQGLPKGVTPGAVKYADVLKDAEARGPVRGSDAYMIGDVVVTRDFNGVSLYNNQGQLISGRGSQYQVGISGNTANGTPQINIAAVGAYGSPEYDFKLAFKGSTGSPITGTVTDTFDSLSPVNRTATTTGTSSTVNNPFTPGTQQYADFNERRSAYDLLYSQFKQYGLDSLVEPLKGLITSGASPAEFTIKLRESDAYKKRFAANQARIQKGLTAISEAEYLGLEDQYQNIMRNYGLPESYYTRGDMGTQEGFNKFIANDVSAAELEDRVMTAQNRVINANPEVLASLRTFYPDINNADILAYTLDPTKGLDAIKRKVTAAEIGGAATQAGLTTDMKRAEELTAAGITKQQAQQGFQAVAEVAPRGGQLAEIYKQDPYTQKTAEAEVFGLSGSAEAARQRKKLTSLETAAFSGSAGAGAIARDRAGIL
jgi:hypothetical protein